MIRSRLMLFSVLPLAATALMAPSALAQDAVQPSAERIAACTADRGGEGCATVLNRVMVCAAAPAMAGCEAVNAAAEAAADLVEDEPNAVDDIEPDVEVRAEGELDGEDESEDGAAPDDAEEPADEDEETED